VRNRQQAAAGLLLVGRHPFPKVLRIGAFVLRERDDLVGLVLAVTEDHVAMQIVAARIRRPLEADQRSKEAGLVVFLGRRS